MVNNIDLFTLKYYITVRELSVNLQKTCAFGCIKTSTRLENHNFHTPDYASRAGVHTVPNSDV